jgi:large conductance mechanosensitive channel protein
MKKLLAEFKEFALKGNMLDLAVGVLIGGAFSGLVTSLTDNIIQPILNCFAAPGADGASKLVIHFKRLNMPIGQFISDILNFILMAFIIFMIVKGINKLRTLGKKPEPEAAPTTKVCPFCKSEISIEAVKCPHCTSDLPIEEPAPAPVVVEKPAKSTGKSKRR